MRVYGGGISSSPSERGWQRDRKQYSRSNSACTLIIMTIIIISIIIMIDVINTNKINDGDADERGTTIECNDYDVIPATVASLTFRPPRYKSPAHPILPYLTLLYPALPYPTLPYPTLPYPTLSNYDCTNLWHPPRLHPQHGQRGGERERETSDALHGIARRGRALGRLRGSPVGQQHLLQGSAFETTFLPPVRPGGTSHPKCNSINTVFPVAHRAWL